MEEKLSNDRIKELKAFCKSRNLHFKDLKLLDLAFHHCSFSNENRSEKYFNNERLEFLGDSVLGLAAADFLYKDMSSNHAEGDLAKIKATVVSEKSLAPIALKFGIDRLLILGHGEELSGGRHKPAILADCMEAVIGAYYMDSGFAACEKYILDFLVPEIRKVQKFGGKDYKTLLQELYQKKAKTCPIYELVSKTGPDHDQVFSVSVKLGNVSYGPARGKSKKEAEQKAAEMAYNEINGM
ncbi:MAG: ribonuclease III [Treponema sp.]|nr:ribonuclease III [Treponema sp.]